MKVQIKKVRDGRPALTCVRDDGSRTWSRTHPFFPIHDLTHLAVESVLAMDQAFYGLVRAGWEIDVFAAPGAAARLPREALVAESIVGLFDLERGTGHANDPAAFNEALTAALTQLGQAPFRPIEATELDAIRKLRDDLALRWSAVPPGETLEVTFPHP